jgi:hypothetical protein
VRRRWLTLAAGAATVAVVGAAIGGYALIGTVGATPTTALGAPRFVDETATAGLDHTYDSGASVGSTTFYVGGGVAVLDCNNDGRPDVYVAGGGKPAALFRNDSPVGGALRFTRVQSPATDLASVTGAYPLDVDGDGHVDLAVLRVGENILLRGNGACGFERANEAWSFDGGDAWTTAFSATWEGLASLPTLAVGNYVTLDTSGKPTFDCAANALFRPDATATGYGPPATLAPGYCALSLLFSDWDRSGRRDLRVANDRHYYVDGSDQLWRMAPGEAPRAYTDADGWVPLQIWGMGMASYDLTGDGYPEYYLTSQGDNKLQTLTSGPAQPTYRDIAQKRGVTVPVPFTGGDVLPSTAWHPEFQDVNNDGFVDLFVSKGNVSAVPDQAAKDPSNLLLGQPDGTFREAADAAGILSFARGRGAALADFNLDGLLDLVEVNLDEPVKVWRNVGAGDAAAPAAMGSWVAIRLSQAGSNRDAIGAWVEVRVGDATMRREITIGGGHIGGQLGPVHVGLGQSSEAQVRVQWPDGTTGPWLRVAANQVIDIEKGAAEARPWQPPVQ